MIYNDTNDKFFMAIHNRQRLIFALRNRASQVFTFYQMFIQIVLDTFQNFLIAPGLILSTSGWRPRPWVPWLITTSWLLCGQFRKMTTMWPRREEFFEQAGLWRRVPTPDMMTVASQWFPANKVLLMTSPFAEKVLYMNWKSALILNGSKMQIRILDLATQFSSFTP